MIEALGTMEKGKFIPADPLLWEIDAPKLEGKAVCIRRVFGRRTRKQGNAWHGVMVPAYMRCMGHLNHDFAHYELVTLLRPLVTLDKKGREHIGPSPTKDMNTKESRDLYRDGQIFMSTEYGENVPDPDPKWRGFNPTQEESA